MNTETTITPYETLRNIFTEAMGERMEDFELDGLLADTSDEAKLFKAILKHLDIYGKQKEQNEWQMREKAFALGWLNQNDWMKEVDNILPKWEKAKVFLQDIIDNN